MWNPNSPQQSGHSTHESKPAKGSALTWVPLLLGLTLLMVISLRTEPHAAHFTQLVSQHCAHPLTVTSAAQEQTPMLFDMVAPGCQSLSFD
jgi:hypothetical protein